MSARREIWEVARHELVERWRSRALRVSLAILLLFVVGGAVAATLAGEHTPTDDFGLVGARAAALAPALRLAAEPDDRKVRVRPLADRAAAVRAVRDGDVDVAIVDRGLIVKDDRPNTAADVARHALAQQEVLVRLERAGLAQDDARAALAAQPPRMEVLEPDARDRERNESMLFIGVLLLFMALIVYGQSVASSVAEEKSSRVIELLLTTVSPRSLLAGKIFGVGALGVVQLATVCAAALAGARVAGGEGLPSGAPQTVALVVGWFVLGFAFYSVAYAALGALVSRQEDLEATTAPVNVLVVAAYFGANAAIESPDGTWAQIAAFLPPLAPMVVPTRVVLGDMGAWGLAGAVAVELLAVVLLTRVAAGIYERSILRVGAPISLRAALTRGPANRQIAVHVPEPVLQAAAVGALLAGVVIGTGEPLGVVLVATGLILVVLHRYRRRFPARG
jgi:ABC-2 type transport system permease protein